MWESKTGIKYNFIVNKPQTNAFVAFVFLWGEMTRQECAFLENPVNTRVVKWEKWIFNTGIIHFFRFWVVTWRERTGECMLNLVGNN